MKCLKVIVVVIWLYINKIELNFKNVKMFKPSLLHEFLPCSSFDERWGLEYELVLGLSWEIRGDGYPGQASSCGWQQWYRQADELSACTRYQLSSEHILPESIRPVLRQKLRFPTGNDNTWGNPERFLQNRETGTQGTFRSPTSTTIGTNLAKSSG